MKATKIIAGLSVVAALGAAALPLSTYAAPSTATETVNVIVNSALFLEVDGATTTTSGVGTSDTTNLSDDVYAASTGAAGYSLYIAATSAADVNLTNATGDKITGSATVAAVAAGTGTPGTSYQGGSYTWGLGKTAFTNTGGSTGQPAWAATSATMPSTASALIASTTTANGATKAGSNGYRVRYGVTIATDQPTGTYAGRVTFTLVDN